jgi:uncharacterized protein YfaS (alpha-2-macroglobulin family)
LRWPTHPTLIPRISKKGRIHVASRSASPSSTRAVTTSTEPVTCDFTPSAGGTYVVSLSAKDSRGRDVATDFYRWATGKDWVPWNDESQFKMDLVPDRSRYSVGDTATVLFASPFTDAEAWVTVEREGLIEQRRLKLTAGSTTLKFPITEKYPPNAFVSVLVARGRSAPPGPLDDPGRPTIRVGYVELRVTPEVKRLRLEVSPEQVEYRPGDTARVRLKVADQEAKGQRAEVTLWAVDQGVLALTGYQTPDPIDLLYAPRGLGLHSLTASPRCPAGPGRGWPRRVAAAVSRERHPPLPIQDHGLLPRKRRDRQQRDRRGESQASRQSHHVPGDGCGGYCG